MLNSSKKISLLTLRLVLLIFGSRCVCSIESLPVCKPGREFWSMEKTGCSPCTKCAPEFTVTPCAVHKDAICGPLSALELDWSFLLSTRKKSEIGQRKNAGTLISRMLFRRFPNIEEQQETLDLDNESTNFSDQHQFSLAAPDFQESLIDSRQRRGSDEASILWDWQTSAMVLAVCACVLFFIVAGCSAIIYVRQSRRIKRNFEPAGLEEISARLNSIVKAELAEIAAGAPMNPDDPETRCQYLEKLLDRKQKTPVIGAGWPETNGNLYIEEGETPRSKRFQIAQIHQNIESILSHKTDHR